MDILVHRIQAQVKETPICLQSCTLAIPCGCPSAVVVSIRAKWKINFFWTCLPDGLYSIAKSQVSVDLTATWSTWRFTYNSGLPISIPGTLIVDMFVHFHFLVYSFYIIFLLFSITKYWTMLISSIGLHLFCLYLLDCFFQTLYLF